MIILGLYFGHNASACVLQDGKVLINWELERHTRIKHDYGYNQAFIDKTLEHCGITMKDVDHIACNYPITIMNYCAKHEKEMPPYSIPTTKGTEFAKFDKGWAVNHHLCHIAGAYYTSPYESATVFSWDGGGDSENSASAKGVGNKIEEYKPEKRNNIAAMWSSLTFNNYRMKRVHEWDPGSGAGKIMGLASYGTPNLDLEAKLHRDLSEAPKPHYFDPRAKAFNDCEDISDTKRFRSQNVAASLQRYTTGKLIQEINNLYTGNQNLCYAGGLALNCIANREIIKRTNFTNLHVPPFPNDCGLAIGAALYVYHHILDNPRTPSYFSPYTGPDYNVGTPDIKRVAKMLRDNKIICYYEGRSESGPRALGHRSILCNPAIPHVRDKLNEHVKHREWYRPYAPIILDKYASKYLLDYNEWSPYMQTSAIIKEEYREELSGVNHVDNTTRPQILRKEHNETLYNIIEESGLPALLNTSFNYQEPIVETPAQAMQTYINMGHVDGLVMGEEIYERNTNYI
tara:strand:- start:59927 stop:61471 length:1545 start_codon:yes stop_codon:yes gene_type:complete